MEDVIFNGSDAREADRDRGSPVAVQREMVKSVSAPVFPEQNGKPTNGAHAVNGVNGTNGHADAAVERTSTARMAGANSHALNGDGHTLEVSVVGDTLPESQVVEDARPSRPMKPRN